MHRKVLTRLTSFIYYFSIRFAFMHKDVKMQHGYDIVKNFQYCLFIYIVYGRKHLHHMVNNVVIYGNYCRIVR